ncbi:hypothetical protein SKAU_G00312240 [Synaphobranchus kaupii]|uniref:PH domain-containing protein n=1 Tax=Synaphobranchus kaupii TaxID=118154 RepID=A0A9Q1ERW9_SYNKA|nr:hypothetical protein SKAU_G00312240 [Synaphobranchus kaupii]
MDPFVEQIAARTQARQESLQQRSAQSVTLQGCEGLSVTPGPLKRQREPLSDNGNLLSSAGHLDSVKRRCLDPVGDKNLNPCLQWVESPPKPHPRRAELEMKPDTPAISSVKSRLKQLTEKQEAGGAVLSGVGVTPLTQKSQSGSEGQEENRAEFHLLGDTEFRSRVERFELGPPQDSPSLSTPRPSVLSGFARDIQEKLQKAETPSTGRAKRIRQERELELLLLRAQPITNNAWLKRSLSDNSLAEAEDGGNGVSSYVQPEDGRVAVTPAFDATPAFTVEPSPQSEHTDAEPSPPEELSTSKMIDQMFAGVLDTTEVEEEEEEGHDEEEGNEGEGNTATESEEERRGQQQEDEDDEREQQDEEEGEGSRSQESSEDELLSPLPSCLLSPLSKAVEAVITPLRLPSSHPKEAQPMLTPEETSYPPKETVPLYSIDAYRTQRSSQKAVQCVTPAGNASERPRLHPQPPVNTKEQIMLVNEEAGRLQSIITQTLQALSCCTDPGHGQGSLEEAEAEKLLLVSCEKHAALLAEVSRLREGGGGGSSAPDDPAQVPCRGTVTVGNVRLPLKADFVSSVRSHTGRPTHYFFVLIRYGAHNIVATPLATAADALNGDAIFFPTSITLRDIPSSFEIDVEVFSLTHCPGNNLSNVRRSTKSKVTPKKFLNTITRTNHSLTSSTLSAVGPRRSSNFTLVGCYRITLQSLGQSKFPLDKMKFEGKVRKLLGDEFQEKVPFLSPLEGNIYLQLDCQGHSHVQHNGFLTVFEDVSGFGAWHRRWFCLDGSRLCYWSYPGDEQSKTPEGSISLLGKGSQCVRPVNRGSCARPHTFELARAMQEGNDHTLDKCWFSADTREERVQWMDKLSQALLDLQTWSARPGTPKSGPFTPSFSKLPQESVL